MNKLNIKKVLATGTIIVGGTGMMLAGLGMSKHVDAAQNQTAQSTQAISQKHHGMKAALTDEQKEKIRAAKVSAIASLSSEEQQTIKNLEAKGHFSLTFGERDQLNTIREKMMTYLNEHPIEGMPTPPAKGGAQHGKQKMESTLTDTQKAELDKLKAEGIAQLSAAEQSRLKELDTKERFDQTDAEQQELHTITEKVMTYVKSKVSFTMPERHGHNRGKASASTPESTQTV